MSFLSQHLGGAGKAGINFCACLPAVSSRFSSPKDSNYLSVETVYLHKSNLLFSKLATVEFTRVMMELGFVAGKSGNSYSVKEVVFWIG